MNTARSKVNCAIQNCVISTAHQMWNNSAWLTKKVQSKRKRQRERIFLIKFFTLRTLIRRAVVANCETLPRIPLLSPTLPALWKIDCGQPVLFVWPSFYQIFPMKCWFSLLISSFCLQFSLQTHKTPAHFHFDTFNGNSSCLFFLFSLSRRKIEESI